nr:hypothetical protein GCM10025732_17410 [Glycomyces mayteni]
MYAATTMTAATTTVFTSHPIWEEPAIPALFWRARPRTWKNTHRTAPSRPSTRVGMRSSTPPTSYPEASVLNVPVVPMVSASRTFRVRPRKMSMPASVTMNAGMRTYAIQNACQTPMSAPMPMANRTAAHHGQSQRDSAIADMAPENARTEPTDRSMWPLTITSIMPIARIRMYEFWRIALVRFCAVMKFWFWIATESTWNRIMISTSATIMP